MDIQALLTHLRNVLPELLAVYLFGSQAQGTAGPDSDLDMAVLLAGQADPVLLWQLSGDLADIAGCPVDLIDLRSASTVMQYQILTRGQRLWAKDVQAGLFESFILSEKTAMNPVREAIINGSPIDGQSSRIFLGDRGRNISLHVARAREEYEKAPATFATDFTRQDAAILNIQRACEAALDMGQHLIRRERLGVPQSARDVFELLFQSGWVVESQVKSLKNMVGFRNIAVHDYQVLQLPITVSIITQHLEDFLQFSAFILRKDVAAQGS